MNRLSLLLGALILLLPPAALAHESVQSGSASVFFHVAPDDVPQPGKEMTIYIGITDTEKGFRLADCACTLTISEKGHMLRQISLTPSTNGEYYGIAGIPFTFYDLTTYTLTVSGEPRTPHLFTPFTTRDDIQVEPSDKEVAPMAMGNMPMGPLDTLNTILLVIAIAFLLGALFFERLKGAFRKRR